MSEHSILLALIGVGLAVAYWQIATRRKKDYREVIEPLLQRVGYRLLSSKAPKPFDVGPFPKFEEMRPRGLETNTPIGGGEFYQYRVVKVVNSVGEEKRFWVRLNFVAFRPVKIDWIPRLE
jgi:hypothetical protein